MPTQLQFRRGTTAQNNAFTGAAGEISIDSTIDTARVHDGTTAGGFELTQNTATQTLTNKTLTSAVLNTGVSGTAVLDEDDMSSDSATQLATQQSIKAYVDSQVTAQDLDFQADSGGALSIDLDSESLTFTGGTGIDTSGSSNTVTFAIDSTVTTLTGTQTLTNKTLTSPTINSATIAMGTNKITGLGDPTSNQDAATKAYVDGELSALSSNSLSEGNTTWVIADSGTGTITATVDGTTHSTFAAAGITLSQGAFVGNVTGDVTGNADTATSAATLTTARAIEVSGAVTGTADFDGSAAINIVTTNTADPTITLGGDLTGSVTLTNLASGTLTATIAANSVALGTDTTGNYVATGAVSGVGLSGSSSSEGGTFTVTSNATSANTASTIVARDASGNFSAGTITAALSGNATTASTLQTARTIGGVSFNGGANINLPGVNTAGNQDTSGTAAIATSVTATANNSTNETVYITFVDGATGTQGIETDTGLSYNPSTNTLTTSVFSGTATTAQYADVAENYIADANYEPGTVLVFGGKYECTICNTVQNKRIIGIVSEKPAYLMNKDLDADHVATVALLGRVPAKVIGEIRKGDMMVSSNEPGHCEAWKEESNPPSGTVLGKALEDKTGRGTGVIEVLVGRL